MRTVAEVILGREPDAVPRARRMVRAALADGSPDLAADAELVVSELTTNAVLHGEPPITVRVRLNRAVRIEIEDAGRQAPILVRQALDAMTGRGLSMVSTVVSNWGVDPLGSGGKVVWAEIDPDRGAALPVVANPQIDVDALLEAWSDDDPATASYTVRLGPVSTQLLLAAKAHIDNVVRELMLMREGEASSGVALPAELAALIRTVTVDFAEARTEIKRQAAAAAADGRLLTELVLHLSASAADAGERYLEALDQADRYARSAHFLTLAPPQVHRVFRRWYVGVIIEQLRALTEGAVPPEPVPFQVVLTDELAALSDLHSTAARLDLMQNVGRDLARAVTVEEMAQIAVNRALEFPGVQSARVRVLDADGRLRSIAWRGRAGREDRRPADLSVDSELPPGVAARTGRPLLLRAETAGVDHTQSAGFSEAGLNGYVVPLVAGGETLGLLTLAFAGGEVSDEAELEFATALADVLGHAVKRSQVDREIAVAEEATRLLERLPGAALGVDDAGNVTVCNLAAARLLEVEQAALIGQPLVSIMPPRYRDAHRAAFSHFLSTGEGGLLDAAPFVVPALRPDGSEVELEMALSATGHPARSGTVALATMRPAHPEPDRSPHPIVGRFLDASVAALAGQKDVLERIVAGEPVESVLAALVRVVESAGEAGTIGAILLLDDDGRHLVLGAAPSMPESFRAAIGGLEIGPEVGSSGTAAHTRSQVVVGDIATDPRWRDYRSAAVEHGLRASWSTPIVAGDGALLGTFTVYYRDARTPSEPDLELMGLLVQTAAIALGRSRADRARDQALAQEQAAREELEVAHRHLSFVLDATTQVTSSLDSDDTLRTLARIAVPALADICLIDLYDGASFRRCATAAGIASVERELAARLGRFSPGVGSDHPAAVAVRTRAAVLSREAPEEFEGIPVDSCVGIPLTARGRTLGAMTLAMVNPGRRYAESDVAMVEDLARRVALAISNVQLYEDSREAERRLALVARAGVSLTSSLDLDTVVSRLLDLVTGDVADRCEVHVRRGPGQWWRFAPGPSLDRLVRVDQLPARVEEAVESGHVVTATSGTGDVFAAGGASAPDSTSSVVPLVAHGEVVGVIAMASFGVTRPARVPADTVAVIAGRAALAIDNALLYEQERSAAEILQRSLLPHHLPVTRGLRSAARYLPAGARNEVGGDWYDLIPLGPGRVSVVMGDVMGRGIPAASIMGQLRNGLRMLATQRTDPAAALGLLNRMLGAEEDSPLATVAYGVLDVAAGTLTMANAGHMPPLLLRPSSASFLDQKPGLPIGAFPDASYTATEHRLEPGDALVMYTDGLIEERARSLEVGLAQLLEVAATAPRSDPEAICEVLLDAFRRDHDEDDTAALVLLLD